MAAFLRNLPVTEFDKYFYQSHGRKAAAVSDS
jgi:hypothetical protein